MYVYVCFLNVFGYMIECLNVNESNTKPFTWNDSLIHWTWTWTWTSKTRTWAGVANANCVESRWIMAGIRGACAWCPEAVGAHSGCRRQLGRIAAFALWLCPIKLSQSRSIYLPSVGPADPCRFYWRLGKAVSRKIAVSRIDWLPAVIGLTSSGPTLWAEAWLGPMVAHEPARHAYRRYMSFAATRSCAPARASCSDQEAVGGRPLAPCHTSFPEQSGSQPGRLISRPMAVSRLRLQSVCSVSDSISYSRRGSGLLPNLLISPRVLVLY